MAFQQLKEYLGSSTLLTIPNMGEELILYLYVSPTVVSAVFIKEEHKVQKLVYYVNKVLIGAGSWDQIPKNWEASLRLYDHDKKTPHYF